MEKSPDAFRTISEVAEWLGVQAHVLRFWESKFSQVKPVKRAGGRRYYRPSDMLLLGGIKKLLHDDGLTIKGVQKILREQGVKHVSSHSKSLDALGGEAAAAEAARDITPSEPEETEATVLQFRGVRGRVETTPQPEPEPEQIEAEETAETAGPDAGQEPAADPAEEPADATPRPVLPSFLHRPAEAAAPPADRADQAGQPDTPAAPAAPPGPAVVDAPDPPPEDQITVSPGVLARLAQLDRLTEKQARLIAPIAAELQAFVQRTGG